MMSTGVLAVCLAVSWLGAAPPSEAADSEAPNGALRASGVMPESNSEGVIRGRLGGYRGLYPFHVAVLRTRDLATPDGPLAWATADPETGRFDAAVPPETDAVYLLGHLDLQRTGPRLDSGMLFFLRKLPVERSVWSRGRMVFELGDMELAHVMRDQGMGSAPFIALGLALLLYGIGWLWSRRLPIEPAPKSEKPGPTGGWALAAFVVLGGSIPLITLNRAPLELLEFTYLHEGLRPETVLSLLTDPISSELSHPPLWPLILRVMASVSRADWWLRVPSVLAHAGFVFVVGRLMLRHLPRPAAWLGTAVAALHGLGIYYGGDAAPYAALGLVSALALDFALRERWRLFAAALVVGFFIHYTVGVLGVALGLSLLWHYRATGDGARFRRALLAFGWVSALPLVWSVHFIRTFLASGMSTRLMSVDYLADPGFFAYVGQFARVVLGLPEAYTLAAPVCAVVVMVGAMVGVRRSGLLGRLVAVQLAMVVGYVLFVHVMYMQFAGGRVFYAFRWASVFLPAVVLCYGFAFAALIDRSRTAGLVGAVVVLHALVFLDWTLATRAQRPDQREAARLIHAERQPGDAFAALPAVYYGQLLNYHLYDHQPADLLAWPRWEDGLYGPLHPVNTSLETLTRNLAFGRVWVADYAERMFGQRKFDPATSAHQLAWMQQHLVPDGRWELEHLTLYRFRVPPDAARLWRDGEAAIQFNRTIENFRYFPELLHTQRTGVIMSAGSVLLRVPVPGDAARLLVSVEMQLGRRAQATDLTLDVGDDGQSAEAVFSEVVGGGRWTVRVPAAGPLLDVRLRRSDAAATDHRGTTVSFRLLHDGPRPAGLDWLAGRWVSRADGKVTTETWSITPEGLEGTSETRTAAGIVVHQERLRIERDARSVVLVASPEGQATTRFHLDSLEGQRAVFANPKHDFPTHITYERSGASLRALIDGRRGNRHEWKFARE